MVSQRRIAVLFAAVLLVSAALALWQVSSQSARVVENEGEMEGRIEHGGGWSVPPVPEGLHEVFTEWADQEELEELRQALPLPAVPWLGGDGKAVLLTSYPTSGNGFVRHVFSNITDISTLKPGSGVPFQRSPWGQVKMESGYRPPLGGLPTMVKTHYPTTTAEAAMDRLELKDYFKGIVLLVRNPGDCVPRNHIRWSACSSARDDLEKRHACYDQHASSSCATSPQLWVQHYRYWVDKIAETGLPHMILRYEDAVERPEQTFAALIDFVFEGTDMTYNREWFRQQMELQAQHEVSDDMGDFLLKCVKAGADRLVDGTRDVFRMFGYRKLLNKGFTWDLPADPFLR